MAQHPHAISEHYNCTLGHLLALEALLRKKKVRMKMMRRNTAAKIPSRCNTKHKKGMNSKEKLNTWIGEKKLTGNKIHLIHKTFIYYYHIYKNNETYRYLFWFIFLVFFVYPFMLEWIIQSVKSMQLISYYFTKWKLYIPYFPKYSHTYPSWVSMGLSTWDIFEIDC